MVDLSWHLGVQDATLGTSVRVFIRDDRLILKGLGPVE